MSKLYKVVVLIQDIGIIKMVQLIHSLNKMQQI